MKQNYIKGTWRLLNQAINKQRNLNVVPNCVNVNGKYITNKQDVSNAFNRHFCDIGPNLAKQIDKTKVKSVTEQEQTRRSL